MSTSMVTYGLIEDVERLEDYIPGGYHPINVDDYLNERYRVVHKLGHGAYSTAWLALDEQTSNYVAVKVGTADAERQEADILSQLTMTAGAFNGDRAANPDATSMIPLAIDRFDISGPNGTHPCFVTAPARCSLMDAKEASGPRLFQLDVARSLAAQLTLAVSFVHSQGYAHGDLHLGNLMLQLPSSLNNLSIDQLYTKFGAPEPEPVLRIDGKPIPEASGVPSHAIPAVWLGIASDELTLSEAKLSLSDFGVAFKPSEESRFHSNAPLIIRPPEAFFEPTTPLSLASDIWSLGCTIFELLAHRSLIYDILTPQDEITAQHVHLQGVMPSDWWNRWDRRSHWFDEAGKPLSNECDIWRWERRFEQWIQEPRQSRGMDVLDEEERVELFKLLQRTLSWKPEDRPTAEEVLDMTWMKRWALPACEAGRKASA